MHVIGAADEIIPRARSDELAAASRGPMRVHVHPGGHFVPTCTGDFKREVASFLDEVAGAATGDGILTGQLPVPAHCRQRP